MRVSPKKILIIIFTEVNMKRIIALVLAAFMVTAVFAGCGGGESKADTGSSASASVDLNAVLDKINSENGLSLEKVTEAKKVKNYYRAMNMDDVKQFAVEMDKSDPNAPVEIVLIEAVDAEAADRVEAALKKTYDDVLSTYTSYTPQKVDMVKACKVTKDGNFVSLIITDNAEAMVKTFQDSVK